MSTPKVAIVTTTIHTPYILSEYATMLGAYDGRIFVAGDRKTPHAEVQALCDDLSAIYLSPEQQTALDYDCSGVIGWNSTARRNIATLEALKWGADVVVTIDDDNVPAGGDWLTRHLGILGFRGQMKHITWHSRDRWLNVGQYADDPFNARGLPMPERRPHLMLAGMAETTEHIGIVNGLTLGDPDMDAIGRLDRQRFVSGYLLPHRSERITIRPSDTWAPLNAQNTSYVRELAPLMGVLPGIGRYDDIWASYIAMKVLGDTEWAVSFGEPYVIHERDRYQHNLWQDLENELYGLQMTEPFIAELRSIDLSRYSSIMERLGYLAGYLNGCELLPLQTRQFLVSWVRDVERVL